MSIDASKDRRGIVFQIIHGSFVDGHGVRTTVFLKGCPLRCVWCCNPEGQAGFLEIKITSGKCNRCENCVRVCPKRAISLNGNREDVRVNIDRDSCTNCKKCIDVCFTGALEVFGKDMSVEEVFNRVQQDRLYYQHSGGGVTIGGGEPTSQPFFTYALLKKCQASSIHTAVDTSGYVVDHEGYKVLEEADLLLYDLKGMDPSEHMSNTGVSNGRILENLKRLAGINKPIIIRVPIVPGYNDSRQGIRRMAEFFSKLKSIERVDLLPYHKYGTVKYGQLGRIYQLNIQPPDIEYMNSLKSLFERSGLKTQVGG
jgi:pyruvate formate lyase activating enzyme